MGRRLWILNQHYPPDLPATAGVLELLATRLVARGWRVRVLAGRPLRPDPDANGTPAREWRDHVEVIRLATHNRRGATLGRLRHYASWGWRAAGRLLAGPRPDVILALSTPPLIPGLLGALMRRLRGVPFVYNVQDLYPDLLRLSRYAGGSLERAGRGVAELVERDAAMIVPLSTQMAATLRERGVPEERLMVIPNPVDTERIRPVAPDRNAWLAEHAGEGEAFRVLHAGNMGFAQGLETLLEAARRLRERSDLRFVLVGGGDARPGLEADARRLGLDNVHFHDFAPSRQIAEVYSAGDLSVVPLRRGVGDFLIPAKLFTSMAAARPVVVGAEAGSEAGRIVVETGCGTRVDPGDPAALATAIAGIAACSDAERREMGDRGRRWVAREHGVEAVADRWDRLLTQVAGGGVQTRSPCC